MLTLEHIAEQYPESLRPFRSSILREYLQYKILALVFASPLASKLSFLGGTALRIIHQNARFSEDIDFDNFGLTRQEFDALASVVRVGLEREGLTVEVNTTAKNAMRCRVRVPEILYGEKLSPNHDEKLMIQIDTLAHDFSYVPESKILNKFDIFTDVSVTPPDILFAQKIAAVFGRKRAKGRDFFDIVFLASFTKPNYAYLTATCNIADAETLRARIMDTIAPFDFSALARDVQPFLFNAADAQKVERFPAFLATAPLE